MQVRLTKSGMRVQQLDPEIDTAIRTSALAFPIHYISNCIFIYR